MMFEYHSNGVITMSELFCYFMLFYYDVVNMLQFYYYAGTVVAFRHRVIEHYVIILAEQVVDFN